MIKVLQANDPSHDILRHMRHPLGTIFAPKTVAVVGATEKIGSVGRTILYNLVSNPFGGTVFPVNPKKSSVLGIKAYPNIAAVPEALDLAVVVTPAQAVPGVIKECADAGVKSAIIISAGFKECGMQGAALEKQILQEARRGNMRVVGPNCLGVMNPFGGLNATFANAIARPGNVGFISQSGALCTAVLDWSLREMVGFSAFVSIGSMLDVGWGDLIDYLGSDPNTQSILIYMETIGDARAFLSAAREVALSKPIIVLKPGRTEAAAKAAASHTGSLTGSDEVLDTAFRRCGVLRVERISDLFHMAEVLAKQSRPKGPRLGIITNAGGPAVLAADAVVDSGGCLAQLSEQTVQALNGVLPAPWSHNNPVDILGDADPDHYVHALDIVAKDPGVDGLLVILTPQAMTDATQTAQKLVALAKLDNKPVLASWMGGDGVAEGQRILARAGIPVFDYPDTAARVFHTMWDYNYHLRSLYETPVVAVHDTGAGAIGHREAQDIIALARKTKRSLLTESESKRLLEAYGIPTVETRVAKSRDEAVSIAHAMGYPVVVKLYSEIITHKTDVGGVLLNLSDADAVSNAYLSIEKSVRAKSIQGGFLGVTVQPYVALRGYEIILGSSIDPQFGPVLLFGAGGKMVEILQDHALALPPLNTTLALRWIERTRIFRALKGIRGEEPADITQLGKILVLFSNLVLEQPWIKEVDINPLLVSPKQILALDARVVLHGPETAQDQLPRSAIRPYPAQYISHCDVPTLGTITLRPIRPEDEPAMVAFHQTLSEQSVYARYFQSLKLDQRVAHERLTRVCFNDFEREIALVAELQDGAIVAVARLSKMVGSDDAEFAVLVSDRFQRLGIGSALLRRLLVIAKQEGLHHVHAQILSDNTGMQRICEKLGFALRQAKDSCTVLAERDCNSLRS